MSETAKPTPGPWMTPRLSPREIVASDGELIAIAYISGEVPGGFRIAEANARLIAAAPTLLAALKTLLAYDNPPRYSDWDPAGLTRAIEAACAAIAKAEGRA